MKKRSSHSTASTTLETVAKKKKEGGGGVTDIIQQASLKDLKDKDETSTPLDWPSAGLGGGEEWGGRDENNGVKEEKEVKEEKVCKKSVPEKKVRPRRDGSMVMIKEYVLLANGGACYRCITQDPEGALPVGTMCIRVVECVARVGLKKCFLTLEEFTAKEQKAFKNGQKVFKAGDSITIIWSEVYERYAAEHGLEPGPPAPPQLNPETQVGDVNPKDAKGKVCEGGENGGTSLKNEGSAKEDGEKEDEAGSEEKNVGVLEMIDGKERKGRRYLGRRKKWYGRCEKDKKSVWIAVTGKKGDTVLWQREMDLVGETVDVVRTGYLCVEVKGVGFVTEMARVYHNTGGKKHRCYRVQIAPSTMLWIDEELLCRWRTEDGVSWIENVSTGGQDPCRTTQTAAQLDAVPLNPLLSQQADEREHGVEIGMELELWQEDELFSFTEEGQLKPKEEAKAEGEGKEEGAPSQATTAGVPDPSSTPQQEEWLDIEDWHEYGFGYEPYDETYSLFDNDEKPF